MESHSPRRGLRYHARRLRSPFRRRLRLSVAATLACIAGALGSLLFSPDAAAGRCPNLTLVLDASDSMRQAPDGTTNPPPGSSRWELAVDAFNELADTYDGQLPIGLSVFANDGSCEGGRLVIAPGYGTAGRIRQAIAQFGPDSGTPTSPTIDNLRKEPALRDAARQQYMLLLTDGDPNCTADEPRLTYEALAAARLQSPSIKTFVLGFGALPPEAAAIMDKMAEAGGTALTGAPRKFYTAEDLPALKAALARILAVVMGEFSSACDDTCYAPDLACRGPGEACVLGACKKNPCDGVSCGPGEYCHTDGTSPARCVAACKAPCPRGTSCRLGRCAEDPCSGACPAGTLCSDDTGRCEPDPLCAVGPQNPGAPRTCRAPLVCRRGDCFEDPCRFVTCPAGSRCVPGDGSCEWAPPKSDLPGPPDMGAPTGGEVWNNGGCALSPTDGPARRSAPFGPALALLLLGLALLAERRLRRS